MHPNAYLRTYWQSKFKPQIFVAMSFAQEYQKRFGEVIEPAIKRVTYRGRRLTATRVDLSKTGDSILSEIVDGIAHSEMVLADVSTVGYDAKSGSAYRNGNVMYEVGVALACRQSSEVLLIRDDRHKFLFDVSTIPHKHLDFADPEQAQQELTEELVKRLQERDHLRDARIALAVASLTEGEWKVLSRFSEYPTGRKFGLAKTSIPIGSAISRLLDKQLIVTAGVAQNGQAIFQWTPLGYTVARNLRTLLPEIATTVISDASE